MIIQKIAAKTNYINKTSVPIRIFLLFVAVFSFDWADCQSANNSANEKVIPNSPNVASLVAYSQIPVSKYTGIPSISIPLYNIESGVLDLPMSVSYHCAGFKPSMEASWIGLGWSLNTSGVISRTIRGGDDLSESISGYPVNVALPTLHSGGWDGIWVRLGSNCPNAPYTQEIVDYRNMISQGQDLQPDLYQYNFSGYSGTFYVKKHSNLNSNVFATVVEQNNLKIELLYSDRRWRVTDGNGIKYYFGTKERSFTYSSEVTSPLYDHEWDIAPDPVPCEDIWNISAWHIDSIVAPTGDKIMFHYSLPTDCAGIKSQTNLSQRHFVGSDMDPGASLVGLPAEIDYYSYSRSVTQEVVLDSIKFNNGSIYFDRSTRSDLDGYDGYTPEKLDSIRINSSSGEIKKIKFTYGYFNQGESTAETRLKLNQVNSGDEIYSFVYDSTALPPKNTLATDHWGFYNGATYNNSPIPECLVGTQTVIFLDGGDREAHNDYIQAGILKEITYPTGAVTKLEYETQQFTNIQSSPDYRTVYHLTEAGEPYSLYGLSGFSQYDFYVAPDYPEESEFINNTIVSGQSHSEVACENFGGSETNYYELPIGDDVYGLLMSIDSAEIGNINYTTVLEYIENSGPYEILQNFQYDGWIGQNNQQHDLCESDYPDAHRQTHIRLQPGWYRVVVDPHPYFHASVLIDHRTPNGFLYDTTDYAAGGVRIKTISTEDNGQVKLYRKYQYAGGKMMAVPFYFQTHFIDKFQCIGENYTEYDGSATYNNI